MPARLRCGIFTLLLVPAIRLLAQDIEITSFRQNGVLSWSNAMESGRYTVEWAPAVTGAWSRSWEALANMPSTGTTMAAVVPMFYRVCWSSNYTGDSVITNEQFATGDDLRSRFDGLLSHIPIDPGTLSFDAHGFFLRDDGEGNLTGDGCGGKIVYATGAWHVNYMGFPLDAGALVRASYQFQPE